MADRTKPFLALNLYLDADSGGTQALARKTLTFHNVQFTARILNFGYVTRGIPFPPGMLQIDDAEIVIEDVDGQIREWFSAVTPFKRVGEIIFDFEADANALTDRSLPVAGWSNSFTSNQPLPDPYWTPLFTGEIVTPVDFEVGKCTIKLREISSLWLDREIPKLITRDNFPNLPDDANEGATDYTAPIIFGICQGIGLANEEPQGVIKCHLIDTTHHYYCVARHQCAQVYSVYRRKKGDSRFFIVSNTEYAVITVNYTIAGVVYPFTIIHFTAQQEDGTFIQAGVNGINYYYDFNSTSQVTGVTQRNPVYSLVNLIYYLLQTEVNIERFDPVTWKNAVAKSNSLGFLMDGAITDTMTVGAAISQICSDFDIDFYQTNQDKLAVGIYDPEGDATVPITRDLVLKNSFKPSLPENVYTQIRYRYAKDNAGLIEFVKASHTGHFGFEEVLRNLNDLSEIQSTGKNGLTEIVVELNFVRDDDVALALIKRRIGYYNLRSYLVEFKVPMPEVIDYLQLTSPLAVTHIQGIGAMGDGWINLAMKVYSIQFDLRTYVATVKAVRRVVVDDGAMEWSYLGFHPVRDVQRRIPPLPVLINGTFDGTGIVPDAVPQLNINDSDPPLPSVAADIPSTFGAAFTDGTTVTDVTEDSDGAAIVPVKWQENPNTTPRKASGYVLVPGGRRAARYYVGTLNPDTRPTGIMTDADIMVAVFYSTDFDHEYWWVGTSETGTTSGWLAKDQCDGDIRMRIYAPLANRGWHLCDGSINIRCSDYKGDTSLITVPDLRGVYLKGASAYDGPAFTAAIAPGATAGSAGAHTHPGSTVASHTHSFSATSSSDGAHTHTITDPGHTHDVLFTAGMFTTSSDGGHTHSGTTSSDGSHAHGYSGTTSTDADTLSGSYTLLTSNDAAVIGFSDTGEDDSWEEEEFLNFADLSGGLSNSGHSHTYSGTTSADGTHSHTYTTSSTGAHTHSVPDTSILSVDLAQSRTTGVSTVSAGAHTHTISGTSGATAPAVTIASDGAHTHSVTVDATGEPKHMGLLPYIRL